MLFFEYHFIFLFLPICFLGYLYCLKHRPQYLTGWLGLSSVVFYSFWDYRNLVPLFISICFNYGIGLALIKSKRQKLLLASGIAGNLLFLGYYKYTCFLLSCFSPHETYFASLTDKSLPLGISFFTFTQLAFLVDTYQKKCREYSFKDYVLFVTYFPHLIAGPIIHHAEMMPQFKNLIKSKFTWENISLGLGIFTLGLIKKVIVADYFVEDIRMAFDAYDADTMRFIDAWSGTLAYTLQIYFDFSGYCDMAVGLSKMFGIKLPVNFHSPYKSTSITEFWRRWHITLSRFLRDYLYIPLGGNRCGEIRRYFNLITTMVLGGIWHGAGWTFILWGTLHGAFLAMHNIWRSLLSIIGFSVKPSLFTRELSKYFTFILVALAWVPFRSKDLATTLKIWKGCLGFNGISIPRNWALKLGISLEKLQAVGIHIEDFASSVIRPLSIPIIIAVLIVVFYAPNSMEIFSKFKDKIALYDKYTVIEHKESKWRWEPTSKWAFIFTILLILGLWCRHTTTEFLYFQF